jgi:hypothetical protein
MSRKGFHRVGMALAIAATLLATTAPLTAAEPHGPAHAVGWRLDTGAIWTWARLWLGLPVASAGPAPLKSVCEGGGSIDPDGHTVCRSQANPNRDGGSSIDPNG